MFYFCFLAVKQEDKAWMQLWFLKLHANMNEKGKDHANSKWVHFEL